MQDRCKDCEIRKALARLFDCHIDEMDCFYTENCPRINESKTKHITHKC